MKFYGLMDDIQCNGMFCSQFDLWGFDRKCVMVGQPVTDWPPEITLYCDEGEVLDWVPNMLHWPILSEKFRLVLEDLQVSELQYLPITINRQLTGIPVGTYFVANILCRVPALDLERSEYSYANIKGENIITGVRRYVLKSNVLTGHDFIRLAELRTEIVVSEKIKHAIELNCISGCSFYQVSIG